MKKTLAVTVAALAASAALAAPAQATALGKSKAEQLAMAVQLTLDSKSSFDRWAKARANRNTEARQGLQVQLEFQRLLGAEGNKGHRHLESSS